jgi:hypothetical protein
MAGATPDEELFINLFLGNVKPDGIKSPDCVAFVYDTQTKTLWEASGDEERGIWKEKVNPQGPLSLGSGRHFAKAAMDFGCSAKEAVNYAKTRDACTGGRVRVYKLK